MTNGEILGKKLYDLRKKNGLSQEEMAERLGVSRQAVSKWECGESLPDTDNLITIARMYSISLDLLVGNDTVESCDEREADGRVEDDGLDGESAQRCDTECEVKKSSLLNDLREIACPIIVTAAFLLCGFLWGIWHIAWILFFLVPIYYSVVEAIKKRKFSEFAYVFLITAVYCVIGMMWGLWDPYWFLFITVPIYCEIAEVLDKKIEKSRSRRDEKADN